MEKNGRQLQEEFRADSLKTAGVAYSAAAVLPVLLSFLVSLIITAVRGEPFKSASEYPDWYIYIAYLLPQLCLAAGAAFFFLRTKEPLTAAWQKCKWYYFPIAVLMQFGLLFSVSELTDLFVKGLELFGYQSAEPPVPALGGWNLLPALLVIALFPAIFEETLFRGILSRTTYQRGWGLYSSALITGALFALFHGSPEQTVYQFVCGACFSLIALRSGSVFPTAVAHFLNNAVILILSSLGYQSSWNMPQGAYIAVCVISGVCFLASLAFLIVYGGKKENRGVKGGKLFFLGAAVGIVLLLAEWIYSLVGGFLGG